MSVKVYTTDTCVFCHAETAWLDELGVKYEEIDIHDDAAPKGVAAVPTTEIDGELIVGFDRIAIKRALKKAGLYERKRRGNR